MDDTGDMVFNHPIHPQLREISAIAPLSNDDARARADVARLLRARAGRFRPLPRHVRTSSVLLVCRPYLFDSWARGRHRFHHDRHRYAHACDRLKSSGRLCCLAPGTSPALSDLPLVRCAQGEWQGMVVELSVTRITSGPQFTVELAESRGRMLWE